MRLNLILRWALGLSVFFTTQVARAEQLQDACVLPSGLQEEMKKYSDTHVVTLADLGEYRRKLFRKEHGGRCPGLVKADFYGDRKPTWAVVLVSGENPHRKAQLIVAHQVDDSWETRVLSTAEGTPVVWREAPGKYESLYYEEKAIRARWPVIVFCGLESWAVVFAWN